MRKVVVLGMRAIVRAGTDRLGWRRRRFEIVAAKQQSRGAVYALTGICL
jgi:hypothetical protein